MSLPHTTAPGLLLGFTGRAGAGKDTCAQLLAQHGFAAIAFADALRAEVAEAWRIDPRMLTDRDTKEWPIEALSVSRCADRRFINALVDIEGGMPADEFDAPRSPRWVMQRWGTAYRRAQDPRYWLDIVARWVGHQRDEARQAHRPALLCITDVRMPNEAALVRALGGTVVQVHRPDLPPMATDTAGHASEQLPPATHEVHNDGDLQHLHAELARVIGLVTGTGAALATATATA